MTYSHKGRKFQVSYYFAYRRPVQMAQEEIAQHAMNCGCTHVLYMDDDIFVFTFLGRKFQVSYYFAYRRPVQMAQEEIAQHAMNCGCTHVLYMDDDIFDVTVED